MTWIGHCEGWLWQVVSFKTLMTSWQMFPMGALQDSWLSRAWQCDQFDAHGTILHGGFLPMECGRSPVGTVFLKSIDVLVATFEKDGSPSCTIP